MSILIRGARLVVGDGRTAGFLGSLRIVSTAETPSVLAPGAGGTARMTSERRYVLEPTAVESTPMATRDSWSSPCTGWLTTSHRARC